jgi:hypothetical protein
VALVEAAIVLLFMGKNAQENLENAGMEGNRTIDALRKFFQRASRHKAGLVAMLMAGLMPPAYWIARPLYVLSAFKPHLPEYLALATHIAPREGFPVESTPGSDEEEDEDSNVAPVQPDFGGNAAEEVARETRVRDEEIAKHRVPKPSHLPVKGKIMPVNVNEKIIDPVFFALSSDLRPSRPDDVGAIAALWWWEETVGQYGSGDGDTNAALQQHCIVMVWDTETRSLLARQSFVGGKPPRTSSHGTRQSGSKPYAEISDFLNHLPHR